MNHTGNSDNYFERKISSSWFSGVCSGIASYFGINIVIVRAVFFGASFLSGLGLMAYLILLIVMPMQTLSEYSEGEREVILENNFKSIIGTLLVLTGLFFIIGTSTFFSLTIISDLLINIAPLLIIVLGIILIKNYVPTNSVVSLPVKLKRSVVEKRISGVCGGFAAYLNFDVTIIRMIWIYSVFATLGITLMLYIILAFVLPKHYGVNTLDK